jgi:hypothetical protein
VETLQELCDDIFILQLKTPFDSEELHSILRSVRILGDVIVVGGSNGFVAVCAAAAAAPEINKTPERASGSHHHQARVMYCYSTMYTAFGKGGPRFSTTAKNKPAAQRRGSGAGPTGHHESSTVVCIACAPANGKCHQLPHDAVDTSLRFCARMQIIS